MTEARARGDARVSAISSKGRRYEFAVDLADRRYEIWFESSVALADSPEAAAIMTLIPAMISAERLHLDRALDPRLLDRLPEVQAILRSWRWHRVFTHGEPRPIEILCAAADRRPGAPGRGEGLFFSGGVDSLEAALATPSVTHLIFVGGFDMFVDDPRLGAVRDHVAGLARSLGKELITVDTNLKDLSDDFGSWIPYYGSAMAGVAQLLGETVSKVRVASGIPYVALHPDGSHPILDHLWSTESVEVHYSRAMYTRTQKIGRLADDPIARSALRVCWEGTTPELNCGRCEKCLRTMVALEAYGVREAFTCFPPELDLEAVAGARFPSVAVRDAWREAFDLVRSAGCDPRLIGAVETALGGVAGAAAEGWGSVPRTAGATPARDADLRRALAGAIEEGTEIRWELEQSQRRAGELEAIVARQSEVLETILGSRSWRLSAPLRRAGGALRRLGVRNRRTGSSADV